LCSNFHIPRPLLGNSLAFSHPSVHLCLCCWGFKVQILNCFACFFISGQAEPGPPALVGTFTFLSALRCLLRCIHT
jgi:hypothetical protein